MEKEAIDGSAEAALAKMGYKSELPRNLSMLSILGLYVIFLSYLLQTSRISFLFFPGVNDAPLGTSTVGTNAKRIMPANPGASERAIDLY